LNLIIATRLTSLLAGKYIDWPGLSTDNSEFDRLQKYAHEEV